MLDAQELYSPGQSTGKTCEPNAVPCPYLKQKYEARQGGMVLCTMSFYLFFQLFSRDGKKPAALVIDEAHRIAEVSSRFLTKSPTIIWGKP